MDIAVIGLGKLGLPMAAVYASKGHSILGVDSTEEIIRALRHRTCPIMETGLVEMLNGTWPQYYFTSQYHVITDSELAFVIVPTPSGSDNKFSNAYIENVLAGLQAIKYAQPVVLVSTIMPETCRALRAKYNLKLIYNPEFIALGSVIHDMLNPDSILIGAEGNEADILVKFHKTIHNAPCHVMSYESAELAKLALNCFVTTKITFANQLAEVCEYLPNGNVDQVTTFLGSDSRVGKKYLKGGLGFGGPCFPRDNEAFLAYKAFAMQSAVISYNNSIQSRLLSKAMQMVEDIETPRIAVLGTSYKPGTHVTERSQSLQLLRALQACRSFDVIGFDPPGKPPLDGADLAVVCTDCTDFRTLDLQGMRHKRVLDCWRTLKNKVDCEMYVALGIHA